MAVNPTNISWSCRRGMKELELYLLPFFDNAYQLLNDEQQANFAQLLKLDDLALFDCLFNQQKLDDPQLQALIHLIKLYRQQHVAN